MICYRDRQWCSQKCGNTDCSRNFTPDHAERASKWWEGFNSDHGAPVDMANMLDTPSCVAVGGWKAP